MGVLMNEERRGFTIIEVMLFLALSGFLLVGVLVGTGTSISTQRYNDAVEDIVDAFRNAYSFVLDARVPTREKALGSCGYLTTGQMSSSDLVGGKDANSGRGRTSCDVYGAAVFITKHGIQTTTVLGLDYYDAIRKQTIEGLGNDNLSDLTIMKMLSANNLAAQCNVTKTDCKIAAAGKTNMYTYIWGTNLHKPANSKNENTSDVETTLLIVRSPRSGAIRTYVMDGVIKRDDEVIDYNSFSENGADALDEYGVYRYLDDSFKQKDVYFCVADESSQAFSNHRRIIHIERDASSQSGIILENMDDVITDPMTGKEVICDDNN